MNLKARGPILWAAILAALATFLSPVPLYAEDTRANCNSMLLFLNTRQAIMPKAPAFVVTELGGLDILEDKIYWNNHVVKIPAESVARRLLIALTDRVNEVVSKADLVLETWPESADDRTGRDHTAALRFQISQLRKAFAKVDPEFARIVSVEPGGYKWVEPTIEISYENVAGFEFNEAARKARWQGRDVRLTDLEFSIFLTLARNGSRPTYLNEISTVIESREGRDHAVHQSEERRRNLVRVHISHLRSAFAEVDPEFENLIVIDDGWMLVP